jgi:N-glycosylase/DNA lyase
MFTVSTRNFNLHQIYDSGQVFTWFPLQDGRTYLIYSQDILCYASQTMDNNWVTVACPEQDNSYWKHYFDVDDVNQTDYAYMQSLVPKEDKYLYRVILKTSGIRILNQDPWDALICFIISQNNNIKRIRSIVQAMLHYYGHIPTREDIRHEPYSLAQFHLGYREKYILGTTMITMCASKSYKDVRNYLLEYKGIGSKVADCICLYGYHFLQACPMDVHMKSIMATHYPDGLPKEYQDYAGVYQQYMFAYDLKTNEEVKTIGQ